MWEDLSVNAKLSLLSGESTVDSFLLSDDEDLMKKIRSGETQEECMTHIENNY